MGYVRDRKLATIIGGPTAGANGNIVTFATPGGFALTFTGMRVTGHDGRAQHHLVGIAPDIRLDPTLDGVRAGRDELLERALAHLNSP
jgi:C-terminal processing protease CtpA/Prc